MSTLIGRLQSSMQLGSVAFTVSPEVRRQTENELLTEAVAEAEATSAAATEDASKAAVADVPPTLRCRDVPSSA